MDIPLNAEVYCTDGLAGHSSCLILNPVRQEITHFVFKRKSMMGYEVMAPISLIAESTPDRILLNISSQQLVDLEPFADSAYVNYDGTDKMFEDYAYGAEDVYALPYCEYAEPVGTYVSTERIPHGELGIHRGAHVEATDGKVGRVDEFVVEPEACHITHLLLHERHIFGDKVVTIPVSEVARIEADVVFLKLSKEAVKKLPHVRTHR